ncbi:MAG: phosphoribosylformylglycinamidine synthase subunit PurL [Chloroflexota bacterium]|nr:phosphoribosylformylglycinamidine synthase subunit PurL [Chloroflexota bacterium]
MTASEAQLQDVALTREEYDQIVELLGREPTPVELGMFGSMWSEHCGYKNSRPVLRHFPTGGPRILQGPGENAGAVDIGDGLAVVFKIESHNHPSAVEPYQGAATGVGGIVRDIFTMGARPIAILDSLRFGPLSAARSRYLFGGVVAGIAGYGNSLGVPTVGGDLFFDPGYAENPLVNAMCVGVVEAAKIMRARASGVGNALILVGAATGRDGIHGASGLASRTDPTARFEELRPAVQVGNPFLEKLLLEACLEALATGAVVGMQDLGAAGLTSSTVETADKGGVGVEIDVRRVTRREAGMTPYEVMLSESQERMLVIVERGREDEVRAIFDRWELHSDLIGHVTGDGMVRVKDGDEVVAEAPARFFTDECPTYYREGREAPELAELRAFDPAVLPDVVGRGAWGVGRNEDHQHPTPSRPHALTAHDALLRLLASPNIASRRPVFRRYDHTIQTNTVVPPGAADAAVVRVKGTTKGLALKTDCNPRYCFLDPELGGAHAVAEATRNVACTGATPLAITDCLNFGSPEKPENFYQLDRATRGMAAACRALGTPVVSGNVSLYNESGGVAIPPTPTVGAVGLLDDAAAALTMAWSEGSLILLLGTRRATLGGSEYLAHLHGIVAGTPPALDLDGEARLQRCLLHLHNHDAFPRSAHDTSEGGLAVALAECAIVGGCGARIERRTLDILLAANDGRLDRALFGEAPSRIIMTIDINGNLANLERVAREHGLDVLVLGTTGGDALEIEGLLSVPVAELRAAWEGGLAEAARVQ